MSRSSAAKRVPVGCAAILAGGLGTRLRSVVGDHPKVLADVGGRPFIEYLLDQLADIGVEYAVICTGFAASQVEDRLRAYRRFQLAFSRETLPLGTGGALRIALPLLRSDPVLVLNGDSYCDADLGAFVHWHRDRGHRASILVAEVDDGRRYGRVELDTDGRVRSFAEKADRPGPARVNAGVYLLDTASISEIAEGCPASLERDLFPRLVESGLHGFATPARLWDIGIPDAYATARESFAASLSR